MNSISRLLASMFLMLFISCAALPTPPVHAADFSFPATARTDWPRGDFWKQISLPEALMFVSVAEVKVSSKNSIYPLKARNGIMFSGKVDDKTFDTLCEILWENGYRGVSFENEEVVNTEDKSSVLEKDIDRVFYRTYYMHKGELMHIEMNKSSRGKLTFTIRYLPEL